MPGIHVLAAQKTWMAGTSPAMTVILVHPRDETTGQVVGLIRNEKPYFSMMVLAVEVFRNAR
jgi:hypothetical protein